MPPGSVKVSVKLKFLIGRGTYIGLNDTLVRQILEHTLDHLHLLVGRQLHNRQLHNMTDRRPFKRNKCVVIDVGKQAHDKLAVHTICHATMARDRVAKVFDLECALEA